jgi:3D-(3,5/4)-trihydroxycyclohexane-1,2-dione acylhydrolase (decyclizing)
MESAMQANDRAIADRARALRDGHLGPTADVSLSEAVVLGLWKQGVRKYVGVIGHGTTDVAHILGIYEAHSLVKFYNVRHETEAAHCASMVRWHYGETMAVLTSIGPGALHAFAGSLVSSSNGLGVYHIYGAGTTHDEGPNMQSLPRGGQDGLLRLVETMGEGYLLHTPEAVFTALRRGAAAVFDPAGSRPCFLLLPMNVQPMVMKGCNLEELPGRPSIPLTCSQDDEAFRRATELARASRAITIKFGGGAEGCGEELVRLADLLDAALVSGARMSGVVPYSHPRFMSVGGSKGSICGNYAMENADLAVVVGARAVCQWDSSGTAWKKARGVVNFNTRLQDASHYNRSVILLGDARLNLRRWIARLEAEGFAAPRARSAWLTECGKRKEEWQLFKRERFEHPLLPDPVWGRPVLTQPAAIEIAFRFARARGAACYFDAGDVQANGFQVAEDERPGLTFSDTGSSYMGFAVSALLAGALADRPVYAFAFTGEGSFTMNPQILIDGVQHRVRGCILLLDNRRMAAITGLQMAQYEQDYGTADSVHADYVAMARSVAGVKGIFGGFTPADLTAALDEAWSHDGLSLVHVPVYWGSDPLGGLGAYGSWNVGSWCEEVQAEHHRIGG